MHTYDTVFIDGDWRPALSRRRLSVVDPFTEQTIAEVPDGGAADIDAAVTAADRAFAGWRDARPAERAALVVRLADELERRADQLARVIMRENGTPISEARHAPVQAAAHLRLVAGLADEAFADDVRLNPLSPGRSRVLRTPLGVAGLITPWNYPLSLIVVKLAPALVAGCTVVIKPAPETPLAARELMDAVRSVGFPPGVVNLVTGGVEAGQALVEHPKVGKISFTGSTAAGRWIGEAAGRLLRPVTLELGGKSAAVALPDTDATVLAGNILKVAMRNTGQTCKACTRLLLPHDRAEELTEAVAETIAAAPLGDPSDPSTFFGPLVSRRHRDRVAEYIRLGIDEGAHPIVGGVGAPRGRGFFVRPTVFVNAENTMRIAREEIFGPVLTVLTYRDVDEAVRLANDSPYGLAGAVFGRDEDAATAVARRIDTGTVGINQYGSNAAAPFSGHKDSGVGTEFGLEGLASYLSYTSIHYAG
ncbi:aldehyde dehydrogenase family protein [Microbacterium sp. B19]|uniref:aldehyde dehydrogenase family protein n=1 Tax=Microbacterium sp. B19 TaxID=96765 RepID=UPI00034A1D40|nr:aldehyde dehydrogenase family protein [Microbacterium sp. B19]